MTKAELIEKICVHYEVQRTDSKFFFETLLRKIYKSFAPEEKFSLNGLADVIINKDAAGLNTISFILDTGEEFVFDIPEDEEQKSNSLESYFSLSFGKPVIPMKGSEESEFLTSHSVDEIRKIIEFRVERIVEATREIEYQQDSQAENFIDNEINFSFMNWKTASIEDKTDAEKTVAEEKDTLTKTASGDLNNQNINNDDNLNETISSEIETIEPDILKTGTDEEKNFQDLSTETENNISEIELSDEGFEDDLIEEELAEDINEEIYDGQIEEVQNFAVPDDNNKVPVKIDGLEIENNEERKSIDENISMKAIPDYLSEPFSSEAEPIDEDNDTSAIKEAFKYAEEKRARLEKDSKQRTRTSYIFSIIILVIIGSVIYFINFYPGKDKTEASGLVQQEETKNLAVIIERSYDYPVTYPYQSGMFAGFYNALSPALANTETIREVQNQNKEEIATTEKQPANLLTGELEIREPVPSVRVKGYIYKYDNMYAVQLSSWKSKSIAESETKKYLNAGYQAFIERTSLSGTIYYRVRVGGFNSTEEAEAFLKKSN